MAALFGCFFVGHSYPIPQTHFTAVDPTHWVLDVGSLVKQEHEDLKEVALFLLAPGGLDPSLALGLYVKCGSSDWLYRGCVHAGHPSEVMPLQWPAPPELGQRVLPGPGFVQLGVSVEPLADVSAKEGSRLGDKLQFAKRVGIDLYRYLESFATQATGGSILIPTNALDKWWERFVRRCRDPDFIAPRQDEKP